MKEKILQSLLFICCIVLQTQAQAPETFDAYYAHLNIQTISNDSIVVNIDMALAPSESGSKLGSSHFNFSFDNQILSNAHLLSHNLSGNYDWVQLKQVDSNKVSLNVSLSNPNNGITLSVYPNFTTIASISFDISSPTWQGLLWLDTILDTRETVVFFDDEITLRHPVQLYNSNQQVGPIVSFPQLEKQNSLDCKVYPNPTQHFVQIELPTDFPIQSPQLSIFNLSGQLIHNQLINTPNTILNTSSWPKGIYLMHLHNNSSRTIKRIIKI